MDGQKIGAAKALAEMVLGSPKFFSDWAMIMPLLGSSEECEAFRVALLLQGRDTRSARLAIIRRRDEILGLRSGRSNKGRELGCKDKKPRKRRWVT